MPSVPRVNVLGVGISAINLDQAVQQIEGWIDHGEQHYVNVCTVHTVMECQQDEELRDIVNRAGMATPDGMPLVWLNKLHGFRASSRVYGPDLMLALCARGATTGHRHFFYGGRPGIVEALVRRLGERYPGLPVAGAHTPPARAVGTMEEEAVLDTINRSGADVVWVGLGTPKQDVWIARHRGLLHAPVLIAVGAAFDFHAGVLKQAPRWMQRNGLEWLYRLSREPRRLAFRYLIYNPLFVGLIILQAMGVRRYNSSN